MATQEMPPGLGQIKALLVGINGYLESNSLSYCVQDATALQKIFSDSKHGMNEKNNIKLMVDDSDKYNLSLIHISEPTRQKLSRMPSSA